MSIEKQSRRHRSALRAFLDRHLPQRHHIADAWRTQLGKRDDVSIDGDRAHLGQALEMRIGLDLVTTLPNMPILGFLPASQCRTLLHACGLASHATSEVPAAETTDPMLRRWVRESHPISMGETERSALNAVLLATEFDTVAHRAVANIVHQQRRLLTTTFEPIPGDPEVAWTDSGLLEPLTHVWKEYLGAGRRELLALGERVLVSPEIVPGFATADLVVGLTLVEIKTSTNPALLVDVWLDQLVGYLLVDRWNALHITQLALYSGWHATTLVITVDKLLRAATVGPAPDLHELRLRFAEALREDLDDADRRHQQRRFPIPAEAIIRLS